MIPCEEVKLALMVHQDDLSLASLLPGFTNQEPHIDNMQSLVTQVLSPEEREEHMAGDLRDGIKKKTNIGKNTHLPKKQEDTTHTEPRE